MSKKRKGKRWLKLIGWIFGILLVLLVGFHFWFKAHARKMLEDMVESRSKGKLKLKLQKFSFNYFSKKMRLEHAVFYSDSTGQATSYRFTIDKIELKAKAILPIVFRNEFMIDSIHLFHPNIVVTRLKPIIKDDNIKKEDVSIPEEMGKIYRSIQDAMKLLKIKRFEITDGSFTLINKIDPSQLPLTITNILFHIDNFKVDQSLKRTNKILFSDNVILNSNNQDIIFPDGRHRLSFSKFNINLKKRLVEFDSCTIAATRGDSSAASFNVFFDALQLTNIDFDTLYKAEVIKADSVYCLNPKFNLDVEVKKKGVAAPPKLSKIIEQLTGDLLLDHVVVNNADFNIKTIRDGNPTSFVFSNNNFEMQGLRVTQASEKPVYVKSFSMAIRNYENFIKDSSYSVRFDSVVFKDDRITLSNFLFNKLNNGRVLNTFSIPKFTLSGLSWDDLVFENKLTANQAIMYNPLINYTASNKMRRKGGMNIFQSLGVLNEYMDLQQLDILDGTIELKLKHDLRVKLEEATLSIKSHSLLESKKLAAIKNSLLLLRFHKGRIHAGNLDIEINDIDYTGQNGEFKAGNLQVVNKDKRTILQDISVKRLLVDETTGDIFAEGLTWKKADIRMDVFGGGKSSSSIVLRSVNGNNTSISGLFNGKQISAKLDHISFNKLEQYPGKRLQLEGVALNGNDLFIKDSKMKLEVSSFNLKDGNNSLLTRVNFKNTTATIFIPSLSFIPHIAPLLRGEVEMDGITAIKPVINIHSPLKNSTDSETTSPLTNMKIGNISLKQPNINYTAEKDSGTISLQWHGENNPADFLEIKDFTSRDNSSRIDQMKFYITGFNYTSPGNRTFSTGNGKLSVGLRNIKVDHLENGPAEWQANLVNFDAKDLSADSIGKNKGLFKLETGSLRNLDISSSLLLNIQKLVAANRAFNLSQMTGKYSDDQTAWSWYNASFARTGNQFHLDSFSIHPLLSRDSFFKKQSFQSDYMDFDCGSFTAGRVNIEKFISDKILDIGMFKADRFVFSDYRDKRLPAKAGLIKQLPVNILKAIEQKISIDTLSLTNSSVNYTEISEKSGLTGSIPITRMQVSMNRLKNYDLKPEDSLHIVASGYLMDSAWIRLSMKESYVDTLSGFLMTVDMKPVDARVFNAVLVPLESVRIESGYLDSMTMKAIGREYLALGEMKLYYRDLKIRFLPQPGKKNTIWLKLKNFIANTFVVKDDNSSRNGVVFYIRDRHRSAINYLVKIAMSGVTGSMGAGNRKLIRRYKKQLELLHLPPIDFNQREKPL